MTLENNSGTRFELHVDRRIWLLEACPYDQAAKGKVDFVPFQSENIVTNTGPEAWRREGDTLAIWCLGQFLEQPHLSVIVPLRSGRSARLSPPTVDEDLKDLCLGGTFPSSRRANFGKFVLLKADGKVRGKFGIKKDRATGRLGSYNPDGCHAIIVDHDFYPELDYATGYWRRYDNGFDGDALSVYIDGLEQQGGPEGLSYSWRRYLRRSFCEADSRSSIATEPSMCVEGAPTSLPCAGGFWEQGSVRSRRLKRTVRKSGQRPRRRDGRDELRLGKRGFHATKS